MKTRNFFLHHPKTASRKIGDEMVVLDQEKNIFMTLNETGGDIWSCCTGTNTIEDIVTILLHTYDVEKKILCSEVELFINQMINEGWLIENNTPCDRFINSEYSAKRERLFICNNSQIIMSQDAEDIIKEKCLRNIHIYAAILELTYNCNEKCRHCYVINGQEKNELSTDEWKSIINQLAEIGALRLVMTGGESLLRPDFLELLTFARELRFAVDIFSNGQLFTRKIAKKVSESYPRSVQFSLYAMSPSLHDSITQVPGSHSKTMDAIRNCIDYKIPLVIKTPIMTINFDEYPLVKKFAIDRGLGYQFSLTISPMNDGRKDNLNLRITDEDKILKYLTDDDINSFDSADFFSAGSGSDPKMLVPCGAGYNSISVSPIGDVYGCNQLLISFGNIRKNSIIDIWNKSESLSKLRTIRSDQLRPCSECDDFQYCNRCPGLAHIEGGDLCGVSPYDCLVTKIRRKIMKGGEISYEKNI